MQTLSRQPVVVILGHVDHGKTTLLDYIRKTNLTEKEAGGITQSIGAFEVALPIKEYASNKITFIDTPGHEAFTKLRARGAEVADCAILLVDAVDSVMPQTIESLYHIKNANIPFVVAVNKIDLPEARIEKVKHDLMKEGVLFDDAGGNTPLIPISARKGTGVDDLLETILFITSLKELKYSSNAKAKAYIIESKKDKSGIVISAIIKDGQLRVGEDVYARTQKAKIKALINDKGQYIKEVTPSTPFQLLGFKELPEVGVELTTLPQIKIDTDISLEPKLPEKVSFDAKQFFQDEKSKKLRVIIKTNTRGSLDAISNSLTKGEIIEVILKGVGEITKSDVFLAKTTSSIVIGFSTAVAKDVVDLARQEKVVIKTYSLIYQLLEELTEVSHLLLEKEKNDKQIKGEAKILATFVIEKEKIAGIKVIKGKLNINDEVELHRGEKLINKAKIVSLKTRARDLDEIKKGMDGGVLFYPQLDFNIGDMVKSYSI